MKQYDVTALGELLIDFTEHGTSNQGNPVLEANPGGAPCNVLAMLAKLGKKTAFIGKVGTDMFGEQLESALKESGITATGLVRDKNVHTTLAFVHKKADGDREFSFCRNPGADMMLNETDLNEDLLKNCSIFHYGSLSMTHENCRAATQKAIAIAKKHNAILSFDPNLRDPLWDNLEQARKQISYGMEHCQILKISDNELRWFTGELNLDHGVTILKKLYDIPLILLSMGKDGSRAYTKGCRIECAAYMQNKVLDTTGAGDTFCACILNYILEHGFKEFSKQELTEMLSFANAAAAFITSKKGALRVMPDKTEIESFIQNETKNV